MGTATKQHVLSDKQLSALDEAQGILEQANNAFSGFMSLLPGSHELLIDHDQLYWLLHPIHSDVSQAMEGLRVLTTALCEDTQ